MRTNLTSYGPLNLGYSDVWIVNGKPVRKGHFLGNVYDIEITNKAQYIDGATPFDWQYYVRVGLLPPWNELGEALFGRLIPESALFAEVLDLIREVISVYREKKVIPEGDIAILEAVGKRLPVDRTSLAVFRDPETNEPKAISGLLDGSVSPGAALGYYDQWSSGLKTRREIQIEDLFPNIVLPERATNGDVFELIRVAVAEDVIDAALPLLSVHAGTLARKYGDFEMVRDPSTVYLLCPLKHVGHYKFFGFVDPPKPLDLSNAKIREPVTVLQMPTLEFINRFRYYWESPVVNKPQ